MSMNTMEGWIGKKNANGFAFRRWQNRWFVLSKEQLTYYKDKEKKELAGIIPLDTVAETRLRDNKKGRFSVQTINARIYALKASSTELARQWVAQISAFATYRWAAITAAKQFAEKEAREAEAKAKAGAPTGSVGGRGEEKKTAARMSSLQRQLFDRLVQAARESKDPMVDRMTDEMLLVFFPNNTQVLKYLIEHMSGDKKAMQAAAAARRGTIKEAKAEAAAAAAASGGSLAATTPAAGGVSPLRKARPTPDEPATTVIKKRGGSPHGTLSQELPPLQTSSPALLPSSASSPDTPASLLSSTPTSPPSTLRVLSPSHSNGTAGPLGTPTSNGGTPTGQSAVMFHRKPRTSDAPKPLFSLNTSTSSNGSDTLSASPPSPITPLGAAARPFPSPTSSSSSNGTSPNTMNVSPLTSVVGDVPIGDKTDAAARPSLSSARFHGRQTSSRSLLGGDAAASAVATAASSRSGSIGGTNNATAGTATAATTGTPSLTRAPSSSSAALPTTSPSAHGRLPSSGPPVNTSTPTAAPPAIQRQLSNGSPASPSSTATTSAAATVASSSAFLSAPSSSPGRVTVHQRPVVSRNPSVSGGSGGASGLPPNRSSPPSPSTSPLVDVLVGEGTLDLAQMPPLADVLSQEAALLVAATRAPSQSDPPMPRRNSFGGRPSVMVHNSRSMTGPDFDFLLELQPVPIMRRSIAFRASISMQTRQSFAVSGVRRCCFAGCDHPNDDRTQPYCAKHRLPQDNKPKAAPLSTIPSVASTPGGSPFQSPEASPMSTPRPSISGRNGGAAGTPHPSFAYVTPAVAAAPLVGAPMVTSARFLSEEEIGVRRAVRKQTAVLAKPTLHKLRSDALTEFAFIKSVLDVMDTSDDLARGLAVRVLWMSLSSKAKEAPLPSLRAAPAGSTVVGASANVAAAIASPKPKDKEVAAALALEPQWRGTVNELGQHFGSYVQLYSSGPQSSRHVINSLFTVLVRDIKEFMLDAEAKADDVSINRPVVNPPVWQALFLSLQATDFTLREWALREINGILVDNAHNCASLRTLRDWQLWIYPLLCDVPMVGPPLKQAAATAAAAAAAASAATPAALSTSPTAPLFVIEDPQTETQKNIYGYCLNVLTLMHYEAYMSMDHPLFFRLMCHSVDLLVALGGETTKVQALVRVMLSALLKKLEHKRLKFPKNMFDCTPWHNLPHILSLVKRFVFRTAHWRDKSLLFSLINGTCTPLVLDEIKIRTSPEPAARFADCDTFGVHWTQKHFCADLVLVEATISLLRALKLDQFDAATAPQLNAQERDFLVWAKDEFHFFQDCSVFFALLQSRLEKDVVDLDAAATKLVSSFVNARNSNDRKTLFLDIGCRNESVRKAMLTGLRGEKKDAPTSRAGSFTGRSDEPKTDEQKRDEERRAAEAAEERERQERAAREDKRRAMKDTISSARRPTMMPKIAHHRKSSSLGTLYEFKAKVEASTRNNGPVLGTSVV